MRAPFLLLVLAAIALVPVPGAAQTVPNSAEQIRLTFAPLVRDAAPAVVNIYTSRIVRERRTVNPLFDDPFFRRFFGDDFPGPMREREREQTSLGSGVIVRPDGLVVTNHHVIQGADQIRVFLSDRTEYDAEVVLSDERTDLAVLQIDGLDGRALPTLDFADADALEVGDLVLAIGNPFGVGQTVTMGIVSALARTTVGISDYSFFIQTDAAINPGNSGGALVDVDGALVGVNTAIFSRDGGSLGIGFAIPADMVRSVVAAAEAGTAVMRPWLGANGQPVTAEIADSLGLDRPAGVLINHVDPRGPGAAAGLEVGDVVVALDDRPVDDLGALRYRIATLTPDAPATLTVRRGREQQDLQFVAALPPEDPPRNVTALTGRHPFDGVRVANINPALVQELGLPGEADSGVIVLEIARGSVADRVGIEPGDIVVALDDRQIERVADLERAIDGTGSPWRISLRRDGRLLTSVVR
ncbi:MAG: Do family serine endopeptidase [Alphaproteobacteria bacterium]|jgi:serine protease Do|nr:Do family serine endopeptidase [Alphaproteobacteria bacterium]